MKHRVWLSLVVVLSLVLALGGAPQPSEAGGPPNGTILYVDVEAAGANDGTSWEDAFTDLQPALEAAVPGDQIWVAAGTYYPSVEVGGTGDRYQTFQMLNGVGIYGGFDPSVGDVGWEDRDWVNNVTVLSGDIGVPGQRADNCYHVFYHPSGTDLDASAVLDGFAVRRGNADGPYPHDSGGGMYNDESSPTLSNCTFGGNSTQNVGGGMLNISSSPTLSNCTFTRNSASDGGGMSNISSSPTLSNCAFTDNSGSGGGGGMSNYSSSPTLTNCSFTGNSAESVDYGGGMYNYGGSPTLTNCILWGDTPDEIEGKATVTYSDIQGGYPGEGNIEADPQWADPGNDDLHLLPCSPAIEAGDNEAPNLPPYDFEGDDRIINGTVDMGVDEANFPPPVTYSLTVASTEGGSVTEPGEGTFSYPCGQIVPLTAVPEPGYRFARWTGHPVADPYSPASAIAMTSDMSVNAGFVAGGGTIYVDMDVSGTGDGTSWEDAYTQLQHALGVALPGSGIWVAAGTYHPTAKRGDGSGDHYKTFQMRNGVGIYGGFDPSVGDVGWQDRDWVGNEAILSCDLGTPGYGSGSCYHVFYHPDGTALDGTAVLDGFTVTGGTVWGPAQTSGGGMYNYASSPTLSNCIFSGNSGADAGGMYNESSSPTLTACTFRLNSVGGEGGGMVNVSSAPTLTHCTFDGNYAPFGGGMVNWYSSPILNDCTFTGNGAEYDGGGMYNYGSSPTLTNCAFEGNRSYWQRGGGMYNSGSSPALTNCTFYGNEAHPWYQGGGMYSEDSTPVLTNCILWGDLGGEIVGTATVTHSDVQGGHAGAGNIDADPLWVDPENGDYHLSAGSPCIDAGTNDAPALPPFDFEGDDRVSDGDCDGLAIVDMGVDEVAEMPIIGLTATNDSPTPIGGATTLTADVESGSCVNYTWAFGDGWFGSGATVTHTYPGVGEYTAVVTATNSVSLLVDATTVVIYPLPHAYLPVVRRDW